LLEVFRRYLAAYGPARPADLAHWFGTHKHTAARAVEALRGELEEVDVEGMRAWRLAAVAKTRTRDRRSVRLTPQFDCYVIGAAPPGNARAHVVPEAAGKSVFHAGGGPYPALLVDGVVAGTWSRQTRGKAVAIHIEPLAAVGAELRRALGAEVARVAEFLETDVTLSLAGGSR
jgi:hypothetical protein